MRRFLAGALLVALAAGMAAVSSHAYQRMGPEHVYYEGVGPGLDATRVVVGGWPLPYVLDRPYLSPVGSADFVGGVLRLDTFRPAPFAADAAFYLALLLLLRAAWRRLRRRAAGRAG